MASSPGLLGGDVGRRRRPRKPSPHSATHPGPARRPNAQRATKHRQATYTLCTSIAGRSCTVDQQVEAADRARSLACILRCGQNGGLVQEARFA